MNVELRLEDWQQAGVEHPIADFELLPHNRKFPSNWRP
jgi:hypothetical protein